MARQPTVRWAKLTKAWRSDVGPRGANGRRTPVYFREIPDTPAGKRLAERALEAYLRKRDRDEAESTQDAANPRVWEGIVEPYLKRYLGELVDQDEASAKTLRSHTERLGRFLAFTPDSGPHAGIQMVARLARTLSDDDAARFIARLKADGCGAKRIDGIFRTLEACFNWAAKPIAGRDPRQIIPTNPFLGVERDKVPRKTKRLPTRAEFARFLRAARKDVEAWTKLPGSRCSGCVRAKQGRGTHCRRSHNRRAIYDRATLLLCRLQYHCGTRPDELCGATWLEVKMPHEDVGLPGWTARASRDRANKQWWGLIVVFAKTSRKKGELRPIPVAPILTRGIERLRVNGLHERWIFPRLSRGSDGRWDSSALAGKVRGWRDAAGLGKTFVLYAMRHRMYTTAVYKAGLSADSAGAYGGTGGETVRSTYLQHDLRSVFDSAQKIHRAGRPQTDTEDD